MKYYQLVINLKSPEQKTKGFFFGIIVNVIILSCLTKKFKFYLQSLD